MAKAIRTICIEIIMYITIVTMCGHVLAHFWDYYVTRNELSQMKHTLDSLKITLNSMGTGYNRLNDEFSEIIKEENYNTPESAHRYKAKIDVSGIKKEPILKNIKQEDGIASVGRKNLKERPAQDGLSTGKCSCKPTIPSLDVLSPGRNLRDKPTQVNKMAPNMNNYSRRSDFSDVIGKPKVRCLCKRTTSYYECYDDENKNSYFELLK